MSKTCNHCGGAGGYNPCPEYNPLDWYPCSYCNGTGEIENEKEKSDERKKREAKLKEAIRNDRHDVF